MKYDKLILILRNRLMRKEVQEYRSIRVKKGMIPSEIVQWIRAFKLDL